MVNQNGSLTIFSTVKCTLFPDWNYGSRRPTRLFLKGFFLLSITFVLSGCYAKLSENYYLAAHDPDYGFTNYFRIKTEGQAVFSSAKYSVGFYDRNAVERLFGETSIEHEYRSTRIELFGDDNKRAKDISAQLTKVGESLKNIQLEELIRLNAAIAEMLARYEVRLNIGPKKAQYLATALEKAKTCQNEATTILSLADSERQKKLPVVQSKLRMANGLLQAIRIAVDGRVLVRFFDGAGNEIDVSNKTQVIFVASDASRFLEALRQLAEDEAATQDIMLTVLAPRIKEAQILAAQVSAFEQEHAALLTRLDSVLATLSKDSKPDAVQGALQAAAGAVAGSGQRFSTHEEIYKFLKGATTP
jgi:hypothetical protein